MGQIYNGWIQASINRQALAISRYQVVFSNSINVA